MDYKYKKRVRQVLDTYLETRNMRKTPERYAILDAVYSIHGHFTIEELSTFLDETKFPVSRATIYNALKLFIDLHLVIRHNLQEGTKYEASYNHEKHCHQICTICGKFTEFNSATLMNELDNLQLKRFKKEGFSLYIYGVCSSCRTSRKKKISSAKKKETT